MGGCSAALDVAEDGEADILFDLARGHEPLHEFGALADAFGDDDDAGVVVAGEAAVEHVDDLLEVEAKLGNDGDLGTGGDGGHEGEVAAPTAHDFDDKAAAVRGGGGADHVDEADDGVEGGVDADA